MKSMLPEEKQSGSLAKLIEAVSKEANLAGPLEALSHAIRNGGNLGAHFDMEKEPDEHVARQIVELVDYLISYLYVLPRRIQALEDALNNSPSETSSADAS